MEKKPAYELDLKEARGSPASDIVSENLAHLRPLFEMKFQNSFEVH